MKLKKFSLKSFAALFSLALFLPNLNLPKEQYNAALIRRENRNITAFPAWKPREKNFYTQLEKWYQERLRFRAGLISFWKQANFRAGVILKDNLFLGKNGWLFDEGAFVDKIVDKEVKIAKLKEIQDFCQARHTDFLFLAAPYKNAVYPDYLPERRASLHPDYRLIEEAMQQAAAESGVNYLSVYQPLLQARSTTARPLYFGNDHHWSYEGAAVATDVLLKNISSKHPAFSYQGLLLDGSYRPAFKDYSQLNTLGLGKDDKTEAPWSGAYSYDIYGTDTQSKKIRQFTENDYPVANWYLRDRYRNGEVILTNKSTENHFTVLILGDSYSSYMAAYLSQFCRTLVLTYFRDRKKPIEIVELEKMLAAYQPDLLLIEMSAPGFFKAKGDSSFNKIRY